MIYFKILYKVQSIIYDNLTTKKPLKQQTTRGLYMQGATLLTRATWEWLIDKHFNTSFLHNIFTNFASFILKKIPFLYNPIYIKTWTLLLQSV